ncbi:MAG: hypothetical protein AAF235_06025, partial [Planctomycetota bacterium]
MTKQPSAMKPSTSVNAARRMRFVALGVVMLGLAGLATTTPGLNTGTREPSAGSDTQMTRVAFVPLERSVSMQPADAPPAGPTAGQVAGQATGPVGQANPLRDR